MKKDPITNAAFYLGFLLQPVARLLTPFVVAEKLRQEIANPQTIDTPIKDLHLGECAKTARSNFIEFYVGGLPYRLACAMQRHREKVNSQVGCSH